MPAVDCIQACLLCFLTLHPDSPGGQDFSLSLDVRVQGAEEGFDLMRRTLKQGGAGSSGGASGASYSSTSGGSSGGGSSGGGSSGGSGGGGSDSGMCFHRF